MPVRGDLRFGSQVLQTYDEQSGSQLTDAIVDTDFPSFGQFSHALSTAGQSLVSVDIAQYGDDTPQANAEATAVFDFVPQFDGSRDDIRFYGKAPSEGWYDATTAYWTISDLTDGSFVIDNSLGGSRAIQSDGPADYVWNSGHTYRLRLSVNSGSNSVPDRGWIGTNLFSVDEPSTLDLLLAVTLIGLIGIAARSRTSSDTIG